MGDHMPGAALTRPGEWTFDDLEQLPDDHLFAKPGEYAEAGIPIYWLVNVEPELRIQGFVLRDGAYIETHGPLPTPWGTFAPDLPAFGLT
jgi:Uma2 family endonuclease